MATRIFYTSQHAPACRGSYSNEELECYGTVVHLAIWAGLLKCPLESTIFQVPQTLYKSHHASACRGSSRHLPIGMPHMATTQTIGTRHEPWCTGNLGRALKMSVRKHNLSSASNTLQKPSCIGMSRLRQTPAYHYATHGNDTDHWHSPRAAQPRLRGTQTNDLRHRDGEPAPYAHLQAVVPAKLTRVSMSRLHTKAMCVVTYTGTPVRVSAVGGRATRAIGHRYA